MDPASRPLSLAFVTLQGFVTAFLLLHDWIPLGRFTNLAAKRNEDPFPKRVFVTLLPALPAAAGLFFSARFLGQPLPHWLRLDLWITYGTLLFGLLRAWWIPYLFVPDLKRAARYEVIFAGTHRFLPERNGFAPDTLHTVFHLATLGVIVLLLVR